MEGSWGRRMYRPSKSCQPPRRHREVITESGAGVKSSVLGLLRGSGSQKRVMGNWHTTTRKTGPADTGKCCQKSVVAVIYWKLQEPWAWGIPCSTLSRVHKGLSVASGTQKDWLRISLECYSFTQPHTVLQQLLTHSVIFHGYRESGFMNVSWVI